MTKFICPGWAGPGRFLGMTIHYSCVNESLPVRPGLVQKSITSPRPDWYQSGPMAAMLGGVDIGSPSAANVHASH